VEIKIMKKPMKIESPYAPIDVNHGAFLEIPEKAHPVVPG
jgi:hypothetical protein